MAIKIGVYARNLVNPSHTEYITSFFDFLVSEEIEILIHPHVEQKLKTIGYDHSFSIFPDKVTTNELDYLISLGGDGTVLDTLRIVRDSGIPVLGINLGRFGFLAHSLQEEFVTNFKSLKEKRYTIDKRTVIELQSELNLFDGFAFGLNDFIVHKKDTSNMITVHTRLNGDKLNSYWADGLILATPTGSTGYSLSCGGPILYPGSSSFVLTPIAPHNLSIRPLVIGDDNSFSFEVEGRTEDFLVTMDSRSETIQKGSKLHVKKADFTFNMILLDNHNYTKTIRNKLLWGFDQRN